MPESCVNGWLKGPRHAAHAAFVAWSTWKAAMHVPELGPPAQAACSESRSTTSSHTPWSDAVTVVVTPAGQLGYPAGHWFCWFAQTRGTARVLHVEPPATQFTHAAPPEPHAPFVKPTAHALPAVQQPAQFAGPQRAWH